MCTAYIWPTYGLRMTHMRRLLHLLETTVDSKLQVGSFWVRTSVDTALPVANHLVGAVSHLAYVK